MVAKAKLYSQLDSLENELRAAIIPHLTNAAAKENDLIFSSSDFKSSKVSKFKVDAKTDALVNLGRQILVLREKLNEPTTNTIAERLCWYCRKYESSGSSRQKVVPGLAQAFLDEILTLSAN